MFGKEGCTGALGPQEVGDWGVSKNEGVSEGIPVTAPATGVVRKSNPLMTFFDYQRYPANPRKAEVAAQFKVLAYALDRDIEDGAEKSTAMRKLIEAQDCIFRALDLTPDL